MVLKVETTDGEIKVLRGVNDRLYMLLVLNCEVVKIDILGY